MAKIRSVSNWIAQLRTRLYLSHH